MSSSSSVRIVSLVFGVVLSVSSVACMVQPVDQGQGTNKGSVASKQNAGENGATSDETDGEGAVEGGGTCAAACAHYLECRSADTSANRTKCVENCNGMGLSSSDLASFVQMDCASAIVAVEGTPPGSSSGGSSSGGGGSKGKECDGCVRDGDSCIWLSQSNWGAGAYSGAAASCESYCCQ